MEKQQQIIIKSNEDLSLFEQNYRQANWFVSPIFDSGHDGMCWGCLKLDMQVDAFEVGIWISDSRQLLETMDETTQQPTFESTSPYCFLRQAKGRYSRFRIHVLSNIEQPFLNAYEITFPYRSHIELIPQMYQKDADLHLFFAPLEDMFLSLQNEIRRMPLMWNPRLATKAQLFELLKVLCLDQFCILSISQIRELLEKRDTWMRHRGTLASLLSLSCILLQRNVMIQECKPVNEIEIISFYHNEEEAIMFQKLIKTQLALGVIPHFIWLMQAQLDHCYLDLSVRMNMHVQAELENAHLDNRLVI